MTAFGVGLIRLLGSGPGNDRNRRPQPKSAFSRFAPVHRADL